MAKQSTTIEFDLGNGFPIKRIRASAMPDVRQRVDIIDRLFDHQTAWSDLDADRLMLIYKHRDNPEAIAFLVEDAMWANQMRLNDLHGCRETIQTLKDRAVQAALDTANAHEAATAPVNSAGATRRAA